MSSSYSAWWKRKIIYKIPFLYKKCPGGNYHHSWDRLCFCRQNEHCGGWHGGIYDFKYGKEYQHCKYCEEEMKDQDEPAQQQKEGIRELWIKKTIYRRYLIRESEAETVDAILLNGNADDLETVWECFDINNEIEYDNEEIILPIDKIWNL